MIRWLVIGAVCLPFTGFGQSEDWSGNSKDDNVGKQQVTYYYDFDSTKIRARGYLSGSGFSDLGKKTGRWEFYFEDGNIEEVAHYVRGKLHGKVIQYYSNGKKKNEGFFYWEVPDSTMRSWNDQGKLLEKGTWEHGKKVGVWDYRYLDGSPHYVEKYKDTLALLMSYHTRDGKQTVKDGNGSKENFFAGSGKLKEKYTYKDGYIDGAFEEFHPSGKPSVQGAYKLGKKEGNWKFWFHNGLLVRNLHYKGGLLHGAYERMYKNGEPQVKGAYKDGMKDGTWEWFPKIHGARDIRGEFLNDERHGKWEQWHLNGQLMSVGYYEHDQKTGKWDRWYENGQLEATGNFENDLKSGDWKFYFETGELWKEGPFNEGARHGVWTTYFESGKKVSEGTFVHGKEDGVWHSWFENGQMMDEGTFRLGDMHGRWSGWYSNGNIRYEGQREDDLETGEWKYYFEKGGLYEQGSYKVFTRKNALGEIYTDMDYKEYKYSRKHGTWTTYSEVDRQLSIQGQYTEGQKSGAWLYYYPGGKVLAVKANYKEGRLHGQYTEYYRRGKERTTIGYKDGLKHGDMKVMTKRGKLVRHVQYKEGLVSKDILNKTKYKYKG